MIKQNTLERSLSTQESKKLLQLLTFTFAVSAYVPLLTRFFIDLWSQSATQYFPFVIIVSVLMIARQWHVDPQKNGDGFVPKFPARILAFGSLAILALAVLSLGPWLAAVSFVMMSGSVFLNWRCAGFISSPWRPWIALWLMIPLPLGFSGGLTLDLQLLSTALSSALMDLFGVHHLIQGSVIELPGKTLFVDEACSGIISLTAIIVCGALYSLWLGRNLVHCLAILMFSAFVATLGNTLRISTIGIAWAFAGLDLSHGVQHTTIGFVTFGVAIYLTISADKLFGAPNSSSFEPIVSNEKFSFRRMISVQQHFSTPLATGYLLLAFVQYAAIVEASPGNPKPLQFDFLAEALSVETLPMEMLGLKRVNYHLEQRDIGDSFGEFSCTYEYRSADGMHFLVSIDFPFADQWHELTTCYRGNGWKVKNRTVEQNENNSKGWGFVTAKLEKSPRETAYLAWCVFDEDGKIVAPPGKSVYERALRHFDRRGFALKGKKQFQVQVFALSNKGAIDQDVMANCEAILYATRTIFRDRVVELLD